MCKIPGQWGRLIQGPHLEHAAPSFLWLTPCHRLEGERGGLWAGLTSMPGSRCVTCAHIPLARTCSHGHTQLQGRRGNVVQTPVQGGAEGLNLGELLGVCSLGKG